MNVLLNGYSIAETAGITGAAACDSAGGKADTCEIILDRVGLLTEWNICDGMKLEIEDNGYSTGEMTLYETEGMPDGRCALRATSLPNAAKTQGWNCFEYVTLRDLMHAGAREMGMEAELYGVRGDIQLRRVVRRGETWPEFLQHVMRNEGATIKFEGGRVLAVGYDWVFGQDAQVILDAEERPKIITRPKYHFLTVRTGLLQATARDTAVAGNASKHFNGSEQIYETAQAIRAAAGMLLACNMDGEIYRREIELDTGLAAMSRVRVAGKGPGSGEWFARSVKHDFIRRKTALELRRCIQTII